MVSGAQHAATKRGSTADDETQAHEKDNQIDFHEIAWLPEVRLWFVRVSSVEIAWTGFANIAPPFDTAQNGKRNATAAVNAR